MCPRNCDLGVIHVLICLGFCCQVFQGFDLHHCSGERRNDRSNGQAIRQEEDEEEEEEIGGSESSEDWEEVDGETIEEVRADGDVMGSTDSELQEWDPTCCFFFDAKSADGSTEGCVKHMHKVHGFFVPDSQCLTDPRGMRNYLGLKVSQSS